jgi:hypothetical protein
MLIANILATGINYDFFNICVVCFLQTVSKENGKFSLTALSTPSIIAPVFSVQPQQHCLSIITILAG